MTATACSTKSLRKICVFNLITILGGSVFLALMAQVAIPLPFTLVPLTLQTLGVLIIGGLLGSKRGPAAVIAYIIQGVMGFPVFAGGTAGFAVLLGPKGGYYLGFVLAAFLVGYIVEKRKGLAWNIPIFLAAEGIILSIGSIWLSLFVGFQAGFVMGFLPFIYCGIAKAIVAATTTKFTHKLIPTNQREA